MVHRKSKTSERDELSKALIFEGATKSELAMIFGKSDRDVGRLIDASSIEPTGERDGYPVFAIKDAAAVLMKPRLTEAQMRQLMRTMHPSEMPRGVGRDFWQGENARLAYEQAEGNLWPTGEVIEFVGRSYKALREALALSPDNMKREGVFTEEALALYREFCEGQINALRSALIEDLEKVSGRSVDQGNGGEPDYSGLDIEGL